MWLVFGGDGQLGRCLDQVLTRGGIEHQCVGRGVVDITNPGRVLDCVATSAPTVVVNAAAWTAVDDAEDHESDAHRINADGAANVARAASRAGARLIHVSTDYVFDGRATEPYPTSATPAPVGAYGRTKLVGERAVSDAGPDRWHILRTAWLYSPFGRNFAKTMAVRALRGEPVRVVDDQRGQPTSALDLARLMLDIHAADARSGLYHATNGGEATWFEFARAIYGAIGADVDLVGPTDTSAYPTKAVRPAFSVLDHAAFAGSGVAPMRHWRDALSDAIDGIAVQVRAELQN